MFSGSISDAVQAREAPVHRSLLQSQNTDGVRMSLWVNNISIHGSVLLSLLIQENTVSLTVRFIKWELSVRTQHSAGKQQAHSVKPLPKRDIVALQKEHQSQRRLQWLAERTLPPPDAVSKRLHLSWSKQ